MMFVACMQMFEGDYFSHNKISLSFEVGIIKALFWLLTVVTSKILLEFYGTLVKLLLIFL